MAGCSLYVALVALAACGDNLHPQPDSAPMCAAGTAFAAGTSWFAETTTRANLTGIGGQRLAVIDFDGDGYPDLLVRRDATGIEDFSSPAGRHTFLLHNRRDGTFEDVTEASGLLARRAGSGGRPVAVVAFADVDNDGDLDAFTGTVTSVPAASDGEHSEIMISDGTGHFTLGPVSDACAASRVDTVAGASFVDFDRDGFIDLWVPQHDDVTGAQAHLFRGDGTGAFTDVTASTGLTTTAWTSTSDIDAGLAHPRATGALACDLDGDGTTELLAPADARTPNHLYQGVRAGSAVTFANRGVASGYAYDGDVDWTDNLFAQCYCKDNPGAAECANVPAPITLCIAGWNPATDGELYRLGGNTESTACGDLDNDGDMDVLTSELRHWYIGDSSDRSEVLVNTGDPQLTFARPGAAAMGLAIEHTTFDWNEGVTTAALFDFDNDGWLDIYEGATDYSGNRGHLYHQMAPLAFEEVATADFFSHFRSQGLAIADFDRDGDLDIVVGHSLMRCDGTECQPTDNIRMFVNTQGSAGNWIELTLSSRTGTINGAAIGARVRVTAGGITQTREIGGGYGHGAQDDATVHVGLGAACEASVEIRWPDAALTTETYVLQAGSRFTVAPGTAPVAD